MQNPNPVIKNYIMSPELFVTDYDKNSKKNNYRELSVLTKLVSIEILLCHNLSMQNKV